MCVIIMIPDGKDLPPLEILEKCESSNKDGAGFAFVDGNTVRWQKGVKLTAKEIHEALAGVPGNKVIHFRIATSGGVKDSLCHPFPISKKAETFLAGNFNGTLLFHNGVWSDWRNVFLARNRKKIRGDWSDTRFIAQLVEEMGTEALEFISSGGQKYTTLSPKEMVKFGNGWEELGGVLYSNKSWSYTYTSKTIGPYPGNVYRGMCDYGSCRNWPMHNSSYCRQHETEAEKHLCKWDRCYDRIPKKFEYCKRHHKEQQELIGKISEQEKARQESEQSIPFVPVNQPLIIAPSSNSNRSGSVMLDNELRRSLGKVTSMRIDDDTGAIIEEDVRFAEILEGFSHPVIDYDEGGEG